MSWPPPSGASAPCAPQGLALSDLALELLGNGAEQCQVSGHRWQRSPGGHRGAGDESGLGSWAWQEAGSMHSRADGDSQGRPEGGEVAELWPCSPGGSPRVRQRQRDGGKTVTFLPYDLAVAFSACLGSSCLPATCAWPGCSHPGRSGALCNRKTELAAGLLQVRPCGLWLNHPLSTQEGPSESSCIHKAPGHEQGCVPWAEQEVDLA